MDPNPYFFFFAGVIIYVFESFHFNADWYNYLFPVFLYPFAEIAQCSSIYMTVAIAVERFIGLCRPFRRLSSRPCPAKAYILPGNQEVFVLLTIDWNISWRSILILMWLSFQMGNISSRIMKCQMKHVGTFYRVSNLGERGIKNGQKRFRRLLLIFQCIIIHSDYVSDISSIMMIANVP